MSHQCCVTSQRRTCWLPDLTLTFCCVHEKSRPIYLLHVRQNHAFSHLWLHILPKSRLFPVFVACSPKSRVFPPHTPTPPHHTGRGYKSRLFPLIPCSPKSRFSHLFLHVRKIHAYSHFLLRKKIAKFASFLRNSFTVPTFVACLPKSRLFPPFVACSPKSRVFPPHPKHQGVLKVLRKIAKIQFFFAKLIRIS